MQKNVKVTFWILLICIGGFLVAWNVRLLLPDYPCVLLALSPEEFELQETVPEGTEFQAEFTLENKARSDLLVKRLKPSCGCTSLSTKDGLPIEVPFVLSPSKPFLVQALVDTKDMPSKRNEAILIRYEYKGKPFVAIGKIIFEVVQQNDADTME